MALHEPAKEPGNGKFCRTIMTFVAGMKLKNKNFAKIVKKKLYDGSQDKTYRFGFKVLS